VILALGLAGLVLSGLLVRVHAQAHAGIASFCTVSDLLDCDRVAMSRFSVFLGLPVAVWGALGYGLATALAVWGLAGRRPHPGWPAGLLVLLSGAAVAASLALALVSELAIGAWCLLCAGSWAIAAGLLAAALRACRPAGAGAAIRADLGSLRARPGRTALVAAAALAVVALAAAIYPRYWEKPRSRAAPPAVALRPGAAAGTLTIVEYSDYACPFCARAHEEMRSLLAEHPEVTLVRRHFPLDPSCNPAVKRAIHPSACSLARAGICAEEQGRFPEMDDALFRNQREGAPLEDLAARVGLEGERFRACLAAPSTAARLAADVSEGIRAGVRATPSYVVAGTVHAGQLPEGLLPAPRHPQGGAAEK